MCLTIKHQAGAVRNRLFLALLVSALLHGYFLYQSLEQKRIKPPEPEVLTVALAPKLAPVPPAPEPIKPKPKPVKPKLAKHKPKPRPPKPTPKPVEPKVVSTAPTTATLPEPIIPATKKIKAEPIVEPVVESNEPEWAQQSAEVVDTDLPDAKEAVVAPYLQVNSLYNVYADTAQQHESRAVLGKASMVYQREQNSYQLHSEVRPSGIMRLFLDDLIQQSRGKVTPQGLQPEYFLYQYDEKKYEVDFDWQAQRLKLQSHKGDTTVVMPTGTQDLLSFMFQFMFTSPLSQTSMIVTNGKGVRQYQYQFMGETLVETALGVFNTIHIVRDDPVKNEQLGLWLAVDYQYLPVRIKKTKPNKNKNYELVIRKLQTDQGEIVGDQSSKAIAQAKAADKPNDQSQTKPEPNTQTQAQPFNPLIQR